jgi:hypothetical protein
MIFHGIIWEVPRRQGNADRKCSPSRLVQHIMHTYARLEAEIFATL